MKKRKVCLIPARGGSKRLPRKNVRRLAGHPLVAHTIMAAVNSGCFDDVIVSSDDLEILDIAVRYSASVDARPKNLAGDTIKATEVVNEFLMRPENKAKWDVVCMCLPTCPLRTPQHLQDAMDIFDKNYHKTPFLIGVTQYEFPPQLALDLDSDGVMSTPVEIDAYLNTRSQDIKPYYHPNGAVYIATVPAYLERKTFFAPQMLSSILPQEASLDIDYEYQFVLIESFLKHFEKKQAVVNG